MARDSWPRYRHWHAPTLIIHGGAATYADVRGSRLLHGIIRARNRQLHIVPDGRHELLNDIVSKEACELILRWFDDRAGRS